MLRETKEAIAEGPVDWLAAVILSWLIPIGLFPLVPVNYFTSLVLWAVPIALLLPRFFQKSDAGGRRRRAMKWTVIYILAAGLILDFIFGAKILKFDEPQSYIIKPLPAIGGTIPLEEILFYLLGGVAIVLVYFWADEHWLNLYSVRHGRQSVPEHGRLLFFSGRTALVGVVLWLCGVGVASVNAGELVIPLYYTLMVALIIIPSMGLFRNVKRYVNWKAFSFTCLWMLLTSCLWEATLGLKRKWWGYEDVAMIGINIEDWGTPFSNYPLEALLVWLTITFTCVLTYEAVKAYQYDPREGMKTRLFGSRRETQPVEAPPTPV